MQCSCLVGGGEGGGHRGVSRGRGEGGGRKGPFSSVRKRGRAGEQRGDFPRQAASGRDRGGMGPTVCGKRARRVFMRAGSGEGHDRRKERADRQYFFRMGRGGRQLRKRIFRVQGRAFGVYQGVGEGAGSVGYPRKQRFARRHQYAHERMLFARGDRGAARRNPAGKAWQRGGRGESGFVFSGKRLRYGRRSARQRRLFRRLRPSALTSF